METLKDNGSSWRAVVHVYLARNSLFHKGFCVAFHCCNCLNDKISEGYCSITLAEEVCIPACQTFCLTSMWDQPTMSPFTERTTGSLLQRTQTRILGYSGCMLLRMHGWRVTVVFRSTKLSSQSFIVDTYLLYQRRTDFGLWSRSRGLKRRLRSLWQQLLKFGMMLFSAIWTFGSSPQVNHVTVTALIFISCLNQISINLICHNWNSNPEMSNMYLY
jgi:hypothetical protein